MRSPNLEKEETEIIETLLMHEKMHLCPFYWRILAFLTDSLLVAFLLSDLLSACDFLRSLYWLTNPIYYGVFVALGFIILYGVYEIFFVCLCKMSLAKLVFRIKIIDIYLADCPSRVMLCKRLGLKIVVFLCPFLWFVVFKNPYHRAWHEEKSKSLLVLF
ncbi:RDD family protein [Helicobacter pylori]|uniref:RDD family protein n=1 Tax=Helicobacter pylori TaxID=210 RepID=UPI000414AC86|nr:RDD family protein [Helicobacter pylori]